MKKSLLLIFPMVYEAEEAFKFFGKKEYPEVGDFFTAAETDSLRIYALCCGFGCSATSQRIANAVKAANPSAVILAGCCGACTPSVHAGEFFYEADGAEAESFCSSLKLRRAKFACVDHIAEDAEKHALFRRGGYECVEMESSIVRDAIAQVAPDAQFAHIRIVSDGLGVELPSAFLASIMDFKSGKITVSKTGTALQILRRPNLLWKLPKFAKALIPVQKKYNAFMAKTLLPRLSEIHKNG